MAKFNRTFLVPYLQDIFALYLAKERLSRLLWEKEEEIQTIKNEPELTEPAPPDLGESDWSNALIYGGICTLVIGISGILTKDTGLKNLAIGMALISLAAVLAGVRIRRLEKKKRQAAEKAFSTLYAAYEEEKNRATLDRQARISAHCDEIKKMQQIRQEADTLLETLYGINIIPGRYRNIYAAFYLYEYFSQSMEDDLTEALKLFVLEEIKGRLDEIIRNQEEMILNQYAVISNQRKGLEMQSRYAAEMKVRLKRIVSSAEEQERYMRMVEANTAATAWFAAAEWLSH